MFNYIELKKLIYWVETGFGVVVLLVCYHLVSSTLNTVGPISTLVSVLVLALVGVACLLFGGVTYLLREDPDVWR
mgnify:FL=1